MRKLLGVLTVVVLILSVTAVGAVKPMSDSQLAAVTAGSDYGSGSASGAIAAGDSGQNITIGYSLSAGASTQQSASGMNLGNVVGGMFAGAVNVWNNGVLVGQLPPDSDSRYNHDNLFGLNMKQVNIITQTSPDKGASLRGYESSGTLNVVNPVLKISNNYSAADFGYVSDDYLQVKNTYDKFAGLKGGFNFSSGGGPIWKAGDSGRGDPATNVSGGFCLICNTYDKFKLTYNDFDAAWAQFEKDQFNLSFKADSVYWRGPISLDGANAGYIAVDGSSQVVTDTSSLALGNNTQYGASGINLVNSVNSLVALAANVASSTAGATNLNTFKQVNVITQK